jgi:hypothetical protein
MAGNTIPSYDLDTYLAQIARGVIENAAPFVSYGVNYSSLAATKHLIYPDDDYTFSYPDQVTGENVSFVSTSDEDGAGTQTGINSIHIHYIDADLNEQFKVITLNGTTPVTGQLSGVRFVQCLHVFTVGDNLAAVGDILAYREGAVNPEDETFSVLEAGCLRCTSILRMVPRNKRLYLRGAAASSISSTADAHALVDIFATEAEGGEVTFHRFLRIVQASVGLQNNSETYIFSPPFVVTEGSVVGGQYTSNKGCTVSMSLFGWFEPTTKPTAGGA